MMNTNPKPEDDQKNLESEPPNEEWQRFEDGLDKILSLSKEDVERVKKRAPVEDEQKTKTS